MYDGEDRLRRVTKKVAGVVTGSEEYWYDEQGARVGVLKRGPTGTKEELRWFIGDTQAHYDGAGVVTKVYSHLSLGTPIARVERTGNANTATNVEYQFHGLASNTLAAVGADGVVNANMAYAPYGELIEAKEGGAAAVGIAAHRRRMNDKYVDELGGLAYYGARYYDNVLIGWTQADPKYRFAPDAAWKEPRRGNLYMFTLGNPVSYVDPDGRDARPTVTFMVRNATTTIRSETISLATRAVQNVATPGNRVGDSLRAGGVGVKVDTLRSERSILEKASILRINVTFTESGPNGDSAAARAGASGFGTSRVVDASRSDGMLGGALIGGQEAAIDLTKVEKGIDGIRSNGPQMGLSKAEVEARVTSYVQGIVDHELSHPAGANDSASGLMNGEGKGLYKQHDDKSKKEIIDQTKKRKADAVLQGETE